LGIPNFSQQGPVLAALRAACKADPLDAVTATLWEAATAFGRERYTVLSDEVRRAFPALSPVPGKR
jgi:hypothetical protein